MSGCDSSEDPWEVASSRRHSLKTSDGFALGVLPAGKLRQSLRSPAGNPLEVREASAGNPIEIISGAVSRESSLWSPEVGESLEKVREGRENYRKFTTFY